MKIKSVETSNFLGIKHAAVDFSASEGLTLIEGINEDSATASSNGAGKSSIFEALLWGLYGVTKRGLKADAVINRSNKKKGCRVTVNFTSGGVEYAVCRTRNDPTDGSTLKLSADEVDLTKGTVKDTQILLESVIKISQVVFEKAVFFGQEDVKSFATLTDRELKQVFEEALGLLIFSENEARVKGYISGIEERVALDKDSIERAARDKTTAILELEHIAEKEAMAERTIAEHLESANARQAELEKKRDAVVAIKEAPESEPADGLAALEANLKELAALEGGLSEKFMDKNASFKSKKTELDTILRDIDKNTKTIQQAGEKIGKSCPTCGQKFDAGAIEKYISTLEDWLAAAELRRAEGQKDLAGQQGAVEKLNSLFTPLKSKIATIQSGINSLKVARAESERARAAAVAELEAIKEGLSSCADMKKKINAGAEKSRLHLKAQRVEKEADVKTAVRKIKSLESDIAAAHGKLATAGMLRDALGNQGAKSYIFDSITPMLNTTIARHMSILDPDIEVELSTMKRLKSGEVREAFELRVENKNGAGEYKGNSGGEKGKIDIAVSLALNDLMRTMDADVGLCFFDEPFENLDAEASEAVVDLLKTIDADNIFITSHNPAIKDLISNKITIVKKGGFATIID